MIKGVRITRLHWVLVLSFVAWKLQLVTLGETLITFYVLFGKNVIIPIGSY